MPWKGGGGRGREQGNFSPAFCTGRRLHLAVSQVLQWRVKKVISKDKLAVLLTSVCLPQVICGGGRRLGDRPVGGQLAPGPVALLGEQRMLPRGAEAHLELRYRSVSFLIFKIGCLLNLFPCGFMMTNDKQGYFCLLWHCLVTICGPHCGSHGSNLE